MRGVSIVISLVISAMMAGCATRTTVMPIPRPALVLGVTQDVASAYRWVLCEAGRDCLATTSKSLASIPASLSLISSSPSPVKQALLTLPAAVATTPMAALAKAAPDETQHKEISEEQRWVVNFAVNSSHLDAAARRLLDTLPVTAETIKIRGYTDATGSTEYNAWLAMRRAERVKEYVIRSGVDPERIRIEALGACCFVASNSTPVGRYANRRVEVLVNWEKQE